MGLEESKATASADVVTADRGHSALAKR